MASLTIATRLGSSPNVRRRRSGFSPMPLQQSLRTFETDNDEGRSAMAIRVAINGFGRTGRAAFRAASERAAEIEWIAINDVTEPAMLAQLLKHDSIYGPFDRRVEALADAILVDGHRIAAPSQSDPGRLQWDELEVVVVIESTGRFRARAD